MSRYGQESGWCRIPSRLKPTYSVRESLPYTDEKHKTPSRNSEPNAKHTGHSYLHLADRAAWTRRQWEVTQPRCRKAVCTKLSAWTTPSYLPISFNDVSEIGDASHGTTISLARGAFSEHRVEMQRCAVVKRQVIGKAGRCWVFMAPPDETEQTGTIRADGMEPRKWKAGGYLRRSQYERSGSQVRIPCYSLRTFQPPQNRKPTAARHEMVRRVPALVRLEQCQAESEIGGWNFFR